MNEENKWNPPDPEAWKPPGKRSDEDSSATSSHPRLQLSLRHYVLDANGEPVEEFDLSRWAFCFGSLQDRKVARTNLGRAYVSTVFLGLDHNYFGGDPILWETMIFRHGDHGGSSYYPMQRCGGSREQAVAMHNEMVRMARKLIRFPKPLSRKKWLRRRRMSLRKVRRYASEISGVMYSLKDNEI